MKKAPTTLIILDGFGVSDARKGNAVRAAHTPVLARLLTEYAHTTLAASGPDVGMPEGRPGNSAAGHANIGGGRIVPQDLPRIDHAIEDGTFFENPALNRAMDACLEKGTALHLMGLLSDGGVHTSMAHLYALLKLASIKGLKRVYLHCFLDGRDAAPTRGRSFVEAAMKKCAELGVGKVATVMGRWYAMAREKHWDRIEAAYDALVYGEGAAPEADVLSAITASYRDGVTDEFLEPICCDRDGLIADNDSVIYFNLLPDRARALTRAFVDPAFSGFKREHFPLTFVCFTVYDPALTSALVAFPRPAVRNSLREYLAAMGLTYLRFTEPEPCLDCILAGEDDVVALTIPDCAEAGHSGRMDAAVQAVESVDEQVGRIVDATLRMGGIALVTGNYGNVEKMLDDEGKPSGANTANRVPFILCGAGAELREGRLSDIAPTILDLLGLEQPPEMTGKTLIVK